MKDAPGRWVKARTVAVSPEAIALAELADASDEYACAITADAADDRTAEDWARAVFEGAPAVLRSFITLGWRIALGLRLGPRTSSSHVLGWRILSAAPTEVVLGVGSRLLSARVVVRVDGSDVTHATMVRYTSRIARVVWPVAAVIHRRAARYLLRHAATLRSA